MTSATSDKPNPLLTGRWDDNQSWEFYTSQEMPDLSLCTAVYCLAILPQEGKVVLTRNHRGWEMLGGHIEPGETIEQALIRECEEEGGFTPENFQLYGYRKITSQSPVPHNQHKGYYPFPHSYIPHFIATSTLPLQQPSGQEILESRAFAITGLEDLNMEQQQLIHASMDFYRKIKTANEPYYA